MSLPPTKPIVPVFVTLAAMTPTRNEPSQSLVTLETTFGAIGSGPTSTRPNFCCGKAAATACIGLIMSKDEPMMMSKPLAGGARQRRLELGDGRGWMTTNVTPSSFCALHALVHHVVEGPVAQPGLRRDEGDLDGLGGG